MWPGRHLWTGQPLLRKLVRKHVHAVQGRLLGDPDGGRRSRRTACATRSSFASVTASSSFLFVEQRHLQATPRTTQLLHLRRTQRRDLADGSVVPCDVTSTYFEGRSYPLAEAGATPGTASGARCRSSFALVCATDGCPVAVDVYQGSTADPGVLGSQLRKLCARFGLAQVRGGGRPGAADQCARIREEVKPAGMDWMRARQSALDACPAVPDS